MFARIALRLAKTPVRSPFARPASPIDLTLPAFHVGAAHARARARRPRQAAESLLDTALAALPRLASSAARELARRRSRLVTRDTPLALG